MKNSTGIQVNKDESGQAKSVTIDIEKHGNKLGNFLKKPSVSDVEDDYFEQKRSEERRVGKEC